MIMATLQNSCIGPILARDQADVWRQFDVDAKLNRLQSLLETLNCLEAKHLQLTFPFRRKSYMPRSLVNELSIPNLDVFTSYVDMIFIIMLLNGKTLAWNLWLDTVLGLCDRTLNAIYQVYDRGRTVKMCLVERNMKNIGMRIAFDHELVKSELLKHGNVTIMTLNGKRYIVMRPSERIFSSKRLRRINFNMDTRNFVGNPSPKALVTNAISKSTQANKGQSCKHTKCLASRKPVVSIREIHQNRKQYSNNPNAIHDAVVMFRVEVHGQSNFPSYQPTDEDCGSITYAISSLDIQRQSKNENKDAAGAQSPEADSLVPSSDLTVYSSRLKSFDERWPHLEGIQRKAALAKCGYYYTGESDLVRCFDCGIGLKDWTFEDDPLFFHLRLSPDCPYVNRTYDQDIIQSYKSRIHSDGEHPHNTRNGMRSPQYQESNVRLESFTNWPSRLPQTPCMLAEAGFYFTGTRDIVRCFYCDGGLQQWDPEDEPWTQHAYWFPDCQFIKDVKGEEYIRLVRLAAEESESDDEEDAINIDGASGACLHEYHKPIFSPVAQNVMAAGFSKASVEMAIEVMSQQGHHGTRLTKDAIIQFLNEKIERGEILPTDPSKPPLSLPEFDESTEEGLLQERDYYNSILLCILCEVKNSDVLFLPCGHHKMCAECAFDVDICPLCEKQVVEKVKTFML